MTVQYIGKYLIIAGAVLAALGLVFIAADKVPWIGRLPGDLLIKREKFTFYFPLTTCLIISAALSAIVYFITRK